MREERKLPVHALHKCRADGTAMTKCGRLVRPERKDGNGRYVRWRSAAGSLLWAYRPEHGVPPTCRVCLQVERSE